MTPDQLKKEIQSNVAAALKQSAVTNSFCSANETYNIVLPQDELNTTLEKVVGVAVEKHHASTVEDVIANISNSLNS